ncbi:MAG: DUF2092 domain-containing protein [Hyphomicrobiales bacterium]
MLITPLTKISQKIFVTSMMVLMMLVSCLSVSMADDNASGDPMIVLKLMSDTLTNKQSLSFTADAIYDEKFEKTYIKSLVSYRIDLIRPATLYFEAKWDDGEYWIGEFNGKRVRVYVPAEKEYSEIPFEGSMDEFINYADDNGITRTPLNDFLRSNLYEALNEQILDATLIEGYVNPEDPDAKISHMLFHSPGTSWQLWVHQGAETLPNALNVTYSDILGRPEYALKFKKWTFPDEPENLAKKYKIPGSLDGWKKVDFENPIDIE